MHSNERVKDSSPPVPEYTCMCVAVLKKPTRTHYLQSRANVADAVLDRAMQFLKQENYVLSEMILSLEAERARVLAALSK